MDKGKSFFDEIFGRWLEEDGATKCERCTDDTRLVYHGKGRPCPKDLPPFEIISVDECE